MENTLEGLELTAKGIEDLQAGSICHFGTGAVLLEEYAKLNGEYFSAFIETTLHRVLTNCTGATGKEKFLFLKDNGPSQNSAKAKESLKTIGVEVVKIPPGSKLHRDLFS